MHKKYGILTAVTLMFASMLHADDAGTMSTSNTYNGGGTVGFAYSTLVPGWGGLVQVGYTNDCWTFDVGGSATSNKFGEGDSTSGTVLGHLGFRVQSLENLFFSMGGMGLGTFYKGSDNHQWSAGLFTGLDYQLNKKFMVQGKVYPYNYDHRTGKAKNNFFANTTISFLYVF